MRTLPLWICLVACGDGTLPPAQPDAAVDSSSTIDAPFPCDRMSCDKATQYCYHIYAGFQAAGCTALPAQCAASPTCDCITPTITDCASSAITCEEHDGAVTAACNLP